jgi:predicted metal-dependent enzyme (double-stranded beta helix superfamily)
LIDTIERQLEAATAKDEHIAALKAGIEAFSTFREYMPQISSSYSRTLLHKNDDFEMVAMRWEPGATTPIHDHGSSNCWVVLLEGAFDVDNFFRSDDNAEIAKLEQTASTHVRRGDLDHRLGWRELHRVTNNEAVPAFSIQVYFGPIHDYVVIDEHTGIVRKAYAQYDAVFDLAV